MWVQVHVETKLGSWKSLRGRVCYEVDMRTPLAAFVFVLAIGACHAASRDPETATVVLPPPKDPPTTVALAEAGAAIVPDGCANARTTGTWSADATHVFVMRTFLDDAFANGEVASSARVVPQIDADGGIAGMRLFGVRAGAFLDRLQFRNGDTVSTVNGQPLTSPESALEAYSAARSAHTIVVGVTRSGAHVDLTLQVCE